MRSPFAPIPGTSPPSRGLFIDRWGTLLELPAEGTCKRFRDASFTPGALDALFQAGQSGWAIYLIGNEDAVAQGHLSDESWNDFEQELLEHMGSQGIHVKRCYACLDHPEGQAPHDKDSVFLLPNTGIFYHSSQNDGIELRTSWVVGDSTLELVAGWRAGVRLAGVRTGQALRDGQLQVEPSLMADRLADVLREITEGARTLRH